MADYNNTINSDNNNNIDISALLQSSSVLHSAVPKHPLESFFLSDSLFDSRSVVSFRLFNHGEAGDEEFSEYFHQPEKKRRLTEKQVQFLEKSFEFENKLEPERKIQLAKDIGLQPRQVAIWFQNRRARWKSKQLEMDFDALQASYDSLKTNYVSLLKEKDKLKAKVLDLTEKLRLRGEGDSAVFDAKKISQELPPKVIANLASESEVLMNSTEVCNPEEFGPAESDIFDTGNPHYAIGFHSSLLDPDHSSYAFEPDQSDVSQDEDDPLNRSLMPEYIFPKIEDVDYSDPPTNSCNFDFPADDQPFWPWS